MDLQTYRESIDFPLKKLTVAYLVRGSEVLLAKKIKKGGLGEGYYLGIGGKVEAGETWEEGAIREIEEEIHVRAMKLSDRGFVNFYFPAKENREKWNFQTKIYVVEEWGGVSPLHLRRWNLNGFRKIECPMKKCGMTTDFSCHLC